MCNFRSLLMPLAVAILGAAGLALAIPADAATLGDARVGFSADRILVFDGKTYTGRMWQMPGKQRHEQDLRAFQPVFILHADSATGDVVLDALHTVVQFAFPAALAVLNDGELLHNPSGEDRVNGIATTRYAIDKDTDPGHAQGSLWLSRDGIPMKLDGKFTSPNGHVTTVRWELKHVKLGPQPAALFEIPSGYSKLPAEAVAPLLGMQLKPAAH